jgi:phenylpropionate dioxygenase-like ring-hydroxylating dioxygenase large terminal subunit
MATSNTIENILWNDWHVVAELETLERLGSLATKLLGIALDVGLTESGAPLVRRRDTGTQVYTSERYGFLWACLGEPAFSIINVPEAAEADRYVITGGSIGVHTSGLRAVENFLDLGHLPFVHANYLGVEPHTEVKPYNVATDSNGILATDCEVFQPIASPSASGGMMVAYTYRVYRAYTVGLTKSNPEEPNRHDVIILFVQPVDEESCIAHSLLAYLKHGVDAPTVRWYMQLIFAQDKPIIENHVPKRLPLDPRAEMPVPSDASSLAYRKWLREKGVMYGAIPARQ